MALFDNFHILDGKKKVGIPSVDSIKKTLFGEKMEEKLIMKVTMLGPRGVGKTSVLTSMYNNMNDAINDTHLHIVADAGTSDILGEKTRALKNMFFNGNDINDAVQSGIAGDSTVSVFSFDFGLNTEKVNIGLELRDFPGEFIKVEPETVKSYILESNAIIVAVDTPHMMESDGRYNAGKNFPSRITQLFKETLNSSSGEKLILFVPLKCEKYYYEGRIDEVTEQIKDTYASLISFLRDRKNENGMKGKFACVVTPILTVGQIVFSGFEADSSGNIQEIVLNDLPIPMKAKYRYKVAGARYSPVYCEQPLYYLLSFVSKQYLKVKDQKEASGWIGKLKKMWALNPKMDDMLLEIQKLDAKKVDNMDGFVTLFGRGKV